MVACAWVASARGGRAAYHGDRESECSVAQKHSESHLQNLATRNRATAIGTSESEPPGLLEPRQLGGSSLIQLSRHRHSFRAWQRAGPP